MKIRSLNERVVVVQFPAEISLHTAQKVQAFKRKIDNAPAPGVLESWTGYHTVAVAYDRAHTDDHQLTTWLKTIEVELEDAPVYNSHEIPVRYHTDTADMIALERLTSLSAADIAQMHQQPDYVVGLLGFQPGFPFLIGLPEALHQPRKAIPNPRVKAGSVAIGGSQTGIYPTESAGGWHIIGETTKPLFTPPDRFLLKAGDHVKFISIG